MRGVDRLGRASGSVLLGAIPTLPLAPDTRRDVGRILRSAQAQVRLRVRLQVRVQVRVRVERSKEGSYIRRLNSTWVGASGCFGVLREDVAAQ